MAWDRRKYMRDYVREWRKTHPLTGPAREKANVRSAARVYRDRGKLVQKPCQVCGNQESEMHHPDYSKPLDVWWLCRPHHLKLHAMRNLARKCFAANNVDRTAVRRYRLPAHETDPTGDRP